MTARTIASTATTITADPFPDYPPRDDMQNFLHLSRPSHMKSLERFFASRPSVSVVSEVPVSRRYGDYSRVRIPDLMVSFDSGLDLMLEHKGYAIDRQGGPPDFALEIASVSTARRDEGEKRRDYESFGVSEYWRFDPTGGERYETALAGDRLVDGHYRPVPIEWLDDERRRGWSEALGLYVCWERGSLRFYDPISQEYLLTHDEEAGRADYEAGRADYEASRADYEASRADAEAALRERAEERVNREAALREQAEGEIARLRARLQELGEDDI